MIPEAHGKINAFASNYDHRVVDKARILADLHSTTLESVVGYEKLACFCTMSDSLAKFKSFAVGFRLGMLRGPAFHKCRLGIRYRRPGTCFAIPSQPLSSCASIAVQRCR
jgi:hypothetical protein